MNKANGTNQDKMINRTRKIKIIDLINENEHLKKTVKNLTKLEEHNKRISKENEQKIREFYEKNWRPKEKKTLLERLIS